MRNCHLTPPPAPASSLSHSQFLNGLSFSLSPSPVFCQAGRLVLWGQKKGQCHAPQTDGTGHWAEGIRHGSVQKGNHTQTHRPGSQGDNSWWVKENWGTMHHRTQAFKGYAVYSAGKTISSFTVCKSFPLTRPTEKIVEEVFSSFT